MIRVTRSTRFKRAYARLIDGRPELEATFHRKLVKFIADPYDPSLGTHKLGGRLKELWAYSLTRKLRVVFTFIDDNSVLLENIGPHDLVY